MELNESLHSATSSKRKYNDLLESIFENWKEKRKCDNFVKDGIWLKNDESIDVDDAWDKAPRRILFMLKDPNVKGKKKADDTRKWLRGNNVNSIKNRNLQFRFMHNMANIFYGLYNTHKDNPCKYGNAELKAKSGDLYNRVKDCFNTQPFAFVETKKEGGGASLSDKKLKDVIDHDEDFLKCEIKVLNPNIIVCTSSIIFDFVQKCFPRENGEKLVSFGKGHSGIKYHPEKDFLVLCSYHPSARKRYGDIYESVMKHFRAFLDSEWAVGSRLG